MDSLFSHLALADIHGKLIRNIVSIRQSQDLFDDLTSNSDEWALAQQVEDAVKPPPYQSVSLIIYRPFEDAKWFNAIGWPFKQWQASRFSDGTFGVWYGSGSAETSVYETAYHWFHGFLSDAGFEKENVVGERQLYEVSCDAALVDLSKQVLKHAGLRYKTDYSFTRQIGERLHREGHPGLLTVSVRHAQGQNYAVLNPDVLSNPQPVCKLTYRLQGQNITVEKQSGEAWMQIDAQTL